MYITSEQRRQSRRTVGITAAGIGSIIVTVATALPLLEVDGPYWIPLLAAGIVIVIGGLAWMLIGWRWPRDRDNEFHAHSCRLAKQEEIPSLTELCQKHLGPVPLPSVKHLQDLHCVNQEMFYIIERKVPGINGHLTETVGCFTVVPLKQVALTGFDEGKLEGGTQLTAAHVTKRRKAAKALYIGVLIGVDKMASGVVLRELVKKVNAYCHKSGIIKVFGRPITDDGLRLMQKHGFTTVPAFGEGPPQMNIVCCKHWKSSDAKRYN